MFEFESDKRTSDVEALAIIIDLAWKVIIIWNKNLQNNIFKFKSL